MLDQELLSLKDYFFRQNFELPEQAILLKLGFKPFRNGLFQRKSKQWVEGGTNHPAPSRPRFFFFFFHSQTLHKILLSHPLKILRPKTKTPRNSTFLITSGTSTLFLINPWKFLLQFLQYPWEFHILNSPIYFFLEQPNEGMP